MFFFFSTEQAVVSILLYGCTTWTLTKRLERRLDGNYTRMLRAVLNKSWRQHPTRLQLYGHLPPITKTIQVRRTRHAGHCWRSKDELISDVLLWTPTHGCARVGRPARTYIQQLCEDTGCNSEDLPEAMNDREKWQETVRDIRAGGATWWWWWQSMNKIFSKSCIIPPLELALDNIVLNYCLLDTTCFTCAEDNFISHQLAWQKADCSKHHRTTEPMSWKKCVNIHCEEKTQWSWPIWQICCQETSVEEAIQCQKAPLDLDTQRVE